MDFFFEQNHEIDDINKVPEHFRGLYAQENGKYVLQESHRLIGTAVDNLNKSLKAARRDADDAKKNRPDISGYTALGQLLSVEETTPEALKGAIEGLLDKVSKGDAGKVNWDKMRADLERAHKQALDGKDNELKGMQGTLTKYLIDNAAIAAIAAEKGEPALLLPHVRTKTKVVKDGDEYVVRVIDASGDPRGNATGGFMSVADLVKEMKTDKIFSRAFESDTPNGSGARPGTTTTRPPAKTGEKSPTEKIAAGLGKLQR